MSGGHWGYCNDTVAGDIFGWGMSPNYGDRGFSQSKIARKIDPLEDKQLSEMLWDMFCLLHSYDWYVCADTGEDTYRRDVKYFKDKWLKPSGIDLVHREIECCVEELKDYLTKTLISDTESANEQTT